MTAFNIDVNGAHEVARHFSGMSHAAAIRVPAIIRHFGQLYQTKVRAGASGRPGPRAITGDYRRSITLEMSTMGGDVAAIIGTVAPQARRLEYGYVGPDSLGRTFSQPPRPHWGPPLGPITEAMEAAIAAMISDLAAGIHTDINRPFSGGSVVAAVVRLT